MSNPRSLKAHQHGPHKCYCPSCEYEELVEANVRCNTLHCPQCGDRMRAVETGERRAISQSEDSAPKVLIWGLLTGLGFGLGLALISKMTKR